MFFVSVSPFAHGHSQGHLSTWMPSICCMALEGVSMSVRELPISPRLGRRVSLPPQSVRKDGHSLPHSQPLKGAPPATTRETRSRALWRSAARVAEASGRSAPNGARGRLVAAGRWIRAGRLGWDRRIATGGRWEETAVSEESERRRVQS